MYYTHTLSLLSLNQGVQRVCSTGNFAGESPAHTYIIYYVCAYICMYMYYISNKYVTHTHTHTHTYTHTHTHTHTHVLSLARSLALSISLSLSTEV